MAQVLGFGRHVDTLAALYAAGLTPEIFEPRRGELRVSHRVLNVLVAEIGLQSSRIMPSIRQRIATGMP